VRSSAFGWSALWRHLVPALLMSLCAGCTERPERPSVPATTRDQSTRERILPFPIPPVATTKRNQGVPPKFRDIAEEAGVDFLRYDDHSRQHRLMEGLGGGVALFDYDGDGRIDIFFTN